MFASHQALMAVHGNANPVNFIEQGNPVLVIGEGQGGVSVIDGNVEPTIFLNDVLVLPRIANSQAINIIQPVLYGVKLLVVEWRKHPANGVKHG